MIIAVCELKNCLKVVEDNETWAILEDRRIVSEDDYFLGDFEVGYYAWEVEGMQMLDNFIPAKGRLGLWEYDL